MQSARVKHYIERAADFLRGAQLTGDDREYRQSSALLAIHSAISFADALRLSLGETGLASDDHSSAVRSLEQALQRSRVVSDKSIGQLKYLIGKKSAVAYNVDRLSEDDIKRIADSAQRFAYWANQVAGQLKLEGWRDATD